LAKVGVKLAVDEPISHLFLSPQTWLSIVGAVIGVMLSAYIYTRFADRIKRPILLFKHSFYVDDIYSAVFVRPLEAVSKLIGRFIEPKIFDGMVLGVSHVSQWIARDLQQMQSGQIRSYVAWVVFGAVLLIASLTR